MWTVVRAGEKRSVRGVVESDDGEVVRGPQADVPHRGERGHLGAFGAEGP